MKKIAAGLLFAALCLLLALSAAGAETRVGAIVLEGQEETIRETLFESPQGFSFWYADERLEAYSGTAGGIEGAVVAALYSDDTMTLSAITEEEAVEYAGDLDMDIVERSQSARVQFDVYRELEDGKYYFLTVVAEAGKYLSAVGEYAQEAAEGNARFFQRVLESVSFAPGHDPETRKEFSGEWAEEYEGKGTVLTLGEDGKMSLYCYSADGSLDYTCEGVWSYEPAPEYMGCLRLQFTSTDNPSWAGKAYGVECVYAAYTESWVENDTEITYLILNPPISCSGISPFEELYGEDSAALHRERGPNMRIAKCKEFVSLREDRSTSSKRLAKVPLGALVLAYPEAGEENGFILCVYHDEYGFILSEYLQPVK